MCGRFDTSNLTWVEIHAQLSRFGTVKTAAANMEPNDDVHLAEYHDRAPVILEPEDWSV